MLGAGGLKFIDPLFQKVVVAECRSRGIPIVYDEVMT
jgi:bifunctional dethiobiotin synthetase / adenosylmethionine---8-amino-7-oxononanoate aminotransferase